MLWVCREGIPYQLYPPIFFRVFPINLSSPTPRSWFNNGQYTTVLGSIFWSQRMQPGSCNSNVQGATFIQPTWLGRPRRDGAKDLAAGSVAGNEKFVGGKPPFSTKGSGKGLEIDIFSEDICRCQSKDWKISDSTLDMQICFTIENEHYLSVANLENKTLLVKYPNMIPDVFWIAWVSLIGWDWFGLIVCLCKDIQYIHKCQGQNSFYWRWS